MVNKIPPKIKKELLYWLSKMDYSKKNLTVKNINQISTKFIKELKKSCKNIYGKKRKSKKTTQKKTKDKS